MSEYTRGEWRADIESGCVVSDVGMICYVSFVNVHSEANARLIAAAPDLLEACKHFYSEFADYGRICNPNSIIAWHHDQKYKEQLLKEIEAAIAKAEV